MPAPTAPSLALLFTKMLGRNVKFVQAGVLPGNKIPQVFGIYMVFPAETMIVVEADLPLLGSFAGAMVGLPDSEVKAHLRVTPIEELLRDAIHEMLNIVSGAITSEGRASFSKLVMDPKDLGEVAAAIFKKPDHANYFNVSIDGYQGGRFAILS